MYVFIGPYLLGGFVMSLQCLDLFPREMKNNLYGSAARRLHPGKKSVIPPKHSGHGIEVLGPYLLSFFLRWAAPVSLEPERKFPCSPRALLL